MKQHQLSYDQMDAAEKAFQWMERSKPSVSARSAPQEDGSPSGIALPPHERGCGRGHPMRGTNSDDLTEWCRAHET